MKLTRLLLLSFSVISLSCKSQTQGSRVELVRPTVGQEAASIWRTINDYPFLEKMGYTIHLPKDALIDSLLTKSKNGTFGNEDFPAIHALLETGLFNEKNYEQAKQKVEGHIGLIDDFINEIDSSRNQWDWEFKTFDTYKVVFTLYGTGGSYDPDEGVITLLTNRAGGFMKYQNPAYTIIHEITHMGMEHSIVRKYNLSHGSKERIVDTFVYLMFQEKLPEYKIQNMGDENIDRYLREKKDLQSISTIASKFANN
ncbi:MAG: hypothetical protein AAF551_06680 [Bacteroidota bacterium]